MKPLPVSPLAPNKKQILTPIAGCQMASRNASIYYDGRFDMLLMAFDPGTTVAGVLTTNKMPGPSINWCRKHLSSGTARGLVVNAGNANVFTGTHGIVACAETAKSAAAVLKCQPQEVMIASTGVIGEPIRYERIIANLPAAQAELADDAWEIAAATIMTTDTFAKMASRTASINGHSVKINGIAKGSGMISPNMATTLSFIVTDAKLPPSLLKAMLTRGIERSFNLITVDGDQSTSDMAMIFATCKSGPENIEFSTTKDPALRDFRRKLYDLLHDLAIQVVSDGEGASKLIRVAVSGAASALAAKRIAMSIANSPLVKAAIAGADANWGRIVMAVGKSGQKANRDKLSIAIGGIEVANNGMCVARYDKSKVNTHMNSKNIDIEVDVGVSRGRSIVWTCDLTHRYLEINADYRN
ncbi:arginine biosynthesis bifunctional protein ArgJ [Candidatus Endolissoclinum faulkneri L5]|uniref:Arginine biosynthesis bifunctional protein ArgJ n=1 Tax=Candidatus Endolissoclinum faulkneri L5 TaxID=1401328 RepID=V9TUV8_9PROT|nr:bifunctional glutamate N-acetyltransferase/amino-acid acetyltransferase ArgJ [Candidatus Endolissoclinum faulkneri]AHC73947.1 arginine biosynthesis bifunctional protein ArgJ [Candidatus Endolissoclinum faulkneri L5]